jgi:hypothetical protein
MQMVKLPRKTHTPKLMDQPAPKEERDAEANALAELETV